MPIGGRFVGEVQAAWLDEALFKEAGSFDARDLIGVFAGVEVRLNCARPHLACPGGLTFDPETRSMAASTGVTVQWSGDGSQSIVWPEEEASMWRSSTYD